MHARGSIFGLTRGSSRGHIVRAALESIAYQTNDVIACIQEDSRIPLKELRVDGGAAQNDLLLQFQSDILNTPVLRPGTVETTALGAAYLAGLGTGYWSDLGAIESNWNLESRFAPEMRSEERTVLCDGWRRAVERSENWSLEGENADQ
jgi:glycerol kinase